IKDEARVVQQTNLIRRLAESGQWERAQRWLYHLQQNRAFKPEDERILQALLDCGQGRYEAVLKLADFPENTETPEGRALLGLAYAHLERKEEALRLATLLAADKGRWRNAIGDIYTALGDLPAALDWYERSGRSYRVTYRLATTLRALGEYREAVFFYRWTL